MTEPSHTHNITDQVALTKPSMAPTIYLHIKFLVCQVSFVQILRQHHATIQFLWIHRPPSILRRAATMHERSLSCRE
jgi:hypothetical protein